MSSVDTGRGLDVLTPPVPVRPVRRRRPPRSLVAAGVVVSAALLVPVAYLVIRATEGGARGFAVTVFDARTLGLLLRTALLAVTVTAGAVAIGVPLAWLTARTDLPGRRVFAVLAALPLVFPSYVGAYAFIAMIGPRGVLQRALGVERLPDIYGFFGAWLTLTLFTYPYVLLTVRAAIRRLDPALEEASLSLGRSRRETIRRVVIPQLRPSIAAGGLLVALYAIHDFGAVSLLRFDSFTRAIYVSYNNSFDRSRAASLAIVLVALTLLVVAAESWTRGRAGYHRVHGSAMRPPRATPLGRWRWPAFAAATSVVLAALVVPLFALIYWMTRSVREGEPLRETVFVAGWHSLSVGVIAALVVVAAAWPVSVLGARHPGWLARQVERASFVGYALPGLVVALALVFFGARYAPAVYQTLPLLIFAYLILFIPQATGSMRASLLQVQPSVEEAARALGDGPWRRFRRIVFPLVRPGVFAGAALVMLTVMKELPATLLLAPTGYDTLATEVFSATNAAFFDRAAPPALALVLVACVPLAALVLREGGDGRR